MVSCETDKKEVLVIEPFSEMKFGNVFPHEDSCYSLGFKIGYVSLYGIRGGAYIRKILPLSEQNGSFFDLLGKKVKTILCREFLAKRLSELPLEYNGRLFKEDWAVRTYNEKYGYCYDEIIDYSPFSGEVKRKTELIDKLKLEVGEKKGLLFPREVLVSAFNPVYAQMEKFFGETLNY